MLQPDANAQAIEKIADIIDALSDAEAIMKVRKIVAAAKTGDARLVSYLLECDYPTAISIAAWMSRNKPEASSASLS